MRKTTLILAASALALLVASTPRPASATVLACQSDVTVNGPPGSLSMSFTGLVGDGSGSYDFLWAFGDGATSTEQNPDHTYLAIGVYNAVLTVTDTGSQESCSDTVRVLAGIGSNSTACPASASVYWGQVPLSVMFSAGPAASCGSSPYSWTWRFGDGEVGAGQAVQHEFTEPGTYWAVATLHTSGPSCDCFPVMRITALKSEVLGVDPPARAGGLRLEPARPNPFGLLTTIAFDLPRPGHARLTILDAHGRTVAELVNEFRPAGPGVRIWQGRASTGSIAPPGLYFARLEHGGEVTSTRLVRIR